MRLLGTLESKMTSNSEKAGLRAIAKGNEIWDSLVSRRHSVPRSVQGFYRSFSAPVSKCVPKMTCRAKWIAIWDIVALINFAIVVLIYKGHYVVIQCTCENGMLRYLCNILIKNSVKVLRPLVIV